MGKQPLSHKCDLSRCEAGSWEWVAPRVLGLSSRRSYARTQMVVVHEEGSACLIPVDRPRRNPSLCPSLVVADMAVASRFEGGSVLTEELGELTTSNCGEAQLERLQHAHQYRERGIGGGGMWREVELAWSWGVRVGCFWRE